jgi:hypothetical protein
MFYFASKLGTCIVTTVCHKSPNSRGPKCRRHSSNKPWTISMQNIDPSSIEKESSDLIIIAKFKPHFICQPNEDEPCCPGCFICDLLADCQILIYSKISTRALATTNHRVSNCSRLDGIDHIFQRSQLFIKLYLSSSEPANCNRTAKIPASGQPEYGNTRLKPQTRDKCDRHCGGDRQKMANGGFEHTFHINANKSCTGQDRIVKAPGASSGT